MLWWDSAKTRAMLRNPCAEGARFERDASIIRMDASDMREFNYQRRKSVILRNRACGRLRCKAVMMDKSRWRVNSFISVQFMRYGLTCQTFRAMVSTPTDVIRVCSVLL